MNRDKFKNIARSSKMPDTTDIMDLVEITKEFPYFSWGYALLAKIYNEREDFRTENLMHQAALRVADRDWLFNFIHNSPEAATQPVLNKEIELEDPIVQEQMSAIEEQDSLTEEQKSATEELAPIVEPQELVIEEQELVIEEQESATEELAPIVEPQELVIEEQEPATEELAPIVEPQELVIEEQQSVFEATKAPNPTLEDLKNAYLKEELFTPETEDSEESDIQETELHSLPESSFFLPVFESETASSTPDNKKNKGYYNIEDYYTLPPESYNDYQFKAPAKEDATAENREKTDSENKRFVPKRNSTNDFYSWLNSDVPQNAPAIKPVERREDLLDKFLKQKPIISRPKQEFYSPEKAGKRSDTLSNKIVTETLANIYYKQGNYTKAIEAYEQLQLKFPEKMSYFANLIEKIKKESIS